MSLKTGLMNNRQPFYTNLFLKARSEMYFILAGLQA